MTVIDGPGWGNAPRKKGESFLLIYFERGKSLKMSEAGLAWLRLWRQTRLLLLRSKRVLIPQRIQQDNRM